MIGTGILAVQPMGSAVEMVILGLKLIEYFRITLFKLQKIASGLLTSCSAIQLDLY